jgi:DNA-binding HxlR family transcriptional regulator
MPRLRSDFSAVHRVQQRWCILIMAEAHRGNTRFEQFQHNLRIASNILSSRLNILVKAGILERHAYHNRPRDTTICSPKVDRIAAGG